MFGANDLHLVCNFKTWQIWQGVVVKYSVNVDIMNIVTTLKKLGS